MSGVNIFKALILCLTPFLLTACQPQDFGRLKPDFSQIKKVPGSFLNIGKIFEGSENEDAVVAVRDSPLPMKDILGDSLATKNRGTDFLTSIKYALDTDPEIVSKRRQIEARSASVGAYEAQKDFQVGATPVSYTHLRAHETKANLVCRLLLEKKKKKNT